VNNEIPVNLWNDLISGNLHSSPFQTYDFFNAVNSLKNLSAEAVAIGEGNRLLSLAVVTFQKEPGLAGFFSSRAIIYGGPVIEEGYDEALELILKHISKTFRTKVIYAEMRNLSDYDRFKEVFRKQSWSYVPYLDFRLRTGDKEKMIGSVSESRLRQIKKAVKTGVTWKEAADITEVEYFYELLTRLYKNRIGKPLLPWEFFKVFYENKLGKYLLVHYQDRIIGGIMCPVLGNRVIYEMYVCGLDEEYKEQYPSIMATWAAIEYASETGIEIFDFMGAGKTGEDYGVRDFKARFGGEMVEYGRFLKVFKPVLFFLGKGVIKYRSKIRK